MISTYKELYDIVSPKLERYRDDLEKHDLKQLEAFDGPFLYGYRPTGTSLLKMGLSLTDWFGKDMTYTPPFGTKQFLKDVDEACDVLLAELVWIMPGADNKWFLHFDGKELKEVTKEEVTNKWKAYVYSLKMSAPFKMEYTKKIAI